MSKAIKEIKLGRGYPPLKITEMGGSGDNNYKDTFAVIIEPHSYLYLWEIDRFIKALLKAKKILEKLNGIKK